MVSPSKKKKPDRKSKNPNSPPKNSPGSRRTTSTKPLANKKFYLDIKNNSSLRQVEAKLTSLGAKLEVFLVKDVNCVVTDRCDETLLRSRTGCSWSNGSRTPGGGGGGGPPGAAGGGGHLLGGGAAPAGGGFSPAGIPASVGGLFSVSPATTVTTDSPEHGALISKRTRSRAEAMLERARQQPQRNTTIDILENAQAWKIPILSLPKFLLWLEKLIKKQERSSNGESTRNGSGVRELRGHFLKIETGRTGRPDFKQFKQWPGLSGGSSTAAFHPPLKPLSRHDPQRMTRKVGKPGKDGSTAPGGGNGYCEICGVHYDQLDAHVSSSGHLKLVSDPAQYCQLDSLIAQHDLGNVTSLRKSLRIAKSPPVEMGGKPSAAVETPLPPPPPPPPPPPSPTVNGHVTRSKTDKILCNGLSPSLEKKKKEMRGSSSDLAESGGATPIKERESARERGENTPRHSGERGHEGEEEGGGVRLTVSGGVVETPQQVVSSRSVDERERRAERRRHRDRTTPKARRRSAGAAAAGGRDLSSTTTPTTAVEKEATTLLSRELERLTDSSCCSELSAEPLQHNLRSRQSGGSSVKPSTAAVTAAVVSPPPVAPPAVVSRRSASTAAAGSRLQQQQPPSSSQRRPPSKQRLSVEEKLIEDNKSYYKVEVLNSKLRSTAEYFLNQQQHQPQQAAHQTAAAAACSNSPPPVRLNGLTSDESNLQTIKEEVKEPVVVRFRKVRKSQLALLSDEAENFMFGDLQRKEAKANHRESTSAESSEDEDCGGGAGAERRRRRSSSPEEQQLSDDSSCSSTSGGGSSSTSSSEEYRRRRRRSRKKKKKKRKKRKQQTPKIPSRSGGCNTLAVGKQRPVSPRIKAPVGYPAALSPETGGGGEEEEGDSEGEPLMTLEDVSFAFERSPAKPPWMDYDPKKFYVPHYHPYPSVTLPYEYPPAERARLFAKRRSTTTGPGGIRRRGDRLSRLLDEGKPRKSPRCHASTLAIMSTLMRRRPIRECAANLDFTTYEEESRSSFPETVESSSSASDGHRVGGSSVVSDSNGGSQLPIDPTGDAYAIAFARLACGETSNLQLTPGPCLPIDPNILSDPPPGIPNEPPGLDVPLFSLLDSGQPIYHFFDPRYLLDPLDSGSDCSDLLGFGEDGRGVSGRRRKRKFNLTGWPVGKPRRKIQRMNPESSQLSSPRIKYEPTEIKLEPEVLEQLNFNQDNSEFGDDALSLPVIPLKRTRGRPRKYPLLIPPTSLPPPPPPSCTTPPPPVLSPSTSPKSSPKRKIFPKNRY